MLKLKLLKKIGIIFLCIIIIQILRIYPNSAEVNEVVTVNKGVIYLLDNHDYLARLEVVYSSNNISDTIREMVNFLTVGNDNAKIREGFSPIIPKNTELLNMSINDDNVTLNFSHSFLDIDEKLEEKMIEAIIFTITSIESINSVTIKVENNLLQKLPHSLKKLPTVLDRSFKINKIYDVDSLDNIVAITVYYPAQYDEYFYYVPVTSYTNSDKEKIEIIIDELKSSNTYNSNLVSYINSETQLISYELLDKSLLLNFNESILGDIVSNNIIEEVTYAINLSVNETYDNVDSVMYYVNDNMLDTYFLLLG